jgi:transposase
MDRSRAGLSTKIHFACDALGLPLGFIVTAAPVADYHQAKPLLQRFVTPGSYVILDKGYDGDSVRECVSQLGGIAVIALNKARAAKPPFDQHLYRERHRIENMFAALKTFRRFATRYEKTLHHFSAITSIACICLWLRR